MYYHIYFTHQIKYLFLRLNRIIKVYGDDLMGAKDQVVEAPKEEKAILKKYLISSSMLQKIKNKQL